MSVDFNASEFQRKICHTYVTNAPLYHRQRRMNSLSYWLSFEMTLVLPKSPPTCSAISFVLQASRNRRWWNGRWISGTWVNDYINGLSATRLKPWERMTLKQAGWMREIARRGKLWREKTGRNSSVWMSESLRYPGQSGWLVWQNQNLMFNG